MIFRVNDSYGNTERGQINYPSPDIERTRLLGKQELFALLSGHGVIWGPEEHTTEGGYRGDPKPSDNSDGEVALLSGPDGELPPEGEVVDDLTAKKLPGSIGHSVIDKIVELAIA